MKKFSLIFTSLIAILGISLFLVSDNVSAATPGWYDPTPWGSSVECRNGYAYTPKNLNNGKCRLNWQSLMNSTISNITGNMIKGFH